MCFFAILGCNLGNITSTEHLHFYHFLDWKATLREVNGIQSLALHTARASSCERSLPSDSLHFAIETNHVTCDTNHSLSPGKPVDTHEPWTYGKQWYGIWMYWCRNAFILPPTSLCGCWIPVALGRRRFSQSVRGEGSIGSISGCEPCRSSTKMV